MIRSATDLTSSAYVGGICQCVPSFTKSVDIDGVISEGFLYHLSHLYGRGSFDVGNEHTRFKSLLQGSSILGEDFHKHFMCMSRETHAYTDRVDMNDVSPFKLGPEGTVFINVKVTRKSQNDFTKVRENVRTTQLMDMLKLNLSGDDDMPFRQENAFLFINRLSVQFVGVPNIHTDSLTRPCLFRVTMCDDMFLLLFDNVFCFYLCVFVVICLLTLFLIFLLIYFSFIV